MAKDVHLAIKYQVPLGPGRQLEAGSYKQFAEGHFHPANDDEGVVLGQLHHQGPQATCRPLRLATSRIGGSVEMGCSHWYKPPVPMYCA